MSSPPDHMPVTHGGNLLMNKLYQRFLFRVSLLHFLIGISWDEFLNNTSALESLSQGQLLGKPK